MSVDKLILSSGNEQILMSISPDWPSIILTGAIGLGSILTSIAVVKISRSNQKSQSQEKIAELRQAWLTELRENMSQFISLVSIISVRRGMVLKFHETEEAKDLYRELLCYRSRLRLMLDEKEEHTIEIKDLIKKLYKAIHAPNSDEQPIVDIANDLEEKCQLVLEKTWKNIKENLAV
ncbi:hypothetical protein [Paraglaciecola sp.]|uniref:hypothetical protein n=1 Tax=Paraglaciecola sp. TaxID=1920173 RepID=UPI00326323DD